MKAPKTKELRYLACTNKKQMETLATFIIANWDELKKEKPSCFIEENIKTPDIARDSKSGEIIQKVIKNKLALRLFYSDPFEDGEIFDIVESKEVYEPIPSI